MLVRTDQGLAMPLQLMEAEDWNHFSGGQIASLLVVAPPVCWLCMNLLDVILPQCEIL